MEKRTFLLRAERASELGLGEVVSVTLDSNKSVIGTLFLPTNPQSMVMFSHGSGFCGPDSVHLAKVLHQFDIGTLLFDLLTPEEAEYDERTGEFRADAVTLGDRLVAATIWLEEHRELRSLELGIFGDDAGAAAAMIASARLPQMVKALVLRSGNVQAARSVWPFVKVPTLLLTGSNDPYRTTNAEALEALPGEKSMRLVEGSETLLADSPRLDFVGHLAAAWFTKYLHATESERAVS